MTPTGGPQDLEDPAPLPEGLRRDSAATIADLMAQVRLLEQEWRRTRTHEVGVAMKSDAETRADVLRELRWDPQVTDPDAIGVAVKDGAKTLTGHVPTYAQKVAATRAAARVYGVRAVADDLEVRLSGEHVDDSDIARSIAQVLSSNIQIPESKVHAKVQAGWVTLEGEVEYDYQRQEVARMVRNVRGVMGITNNIKVSPPVSAERVAAEIEEAFKREAEVEVSDHTATLYGHVHSLHEATKVESRIMVSP